MAKVQAPLNRIKIVSIGIITIAALIVFRLFFLMVIQHEFYSQLAAGSHELFAKLFPKRGRIYVQDTRTGEEYPLAMNRDVFLMYANTKEILDDDTANDVAEKLSELFSYDDEQKLALYYQLNKRTDPYEPIEKRLERPKKEEIEALNLKGIHFSRVPERFYPEGNVASSVVGFLGKNDEGQDVGRYGVEGYFNDVLAGQQGFLAGIRSAKGNLIASAGKDSKSARDGADVLLTIDRTLQFQTCQMLDKYMKEYEAETASLVIMDPYSGAIRVMCSLPSFDPNKYNLVEDGAVYNNSNIFTPYEPGSIFKPIVMAAAVNEELITPNTVFHDSGSREGVCQTPIRNADRKIYKDQTMNGVLENSINTGMVYVAELLGKDKLKEYIEEFGFGVKGGVELHSEVSGTIDSLSLNDSDKLDCYAATASFGQGITATPLQMVSAFSSIANGGTLMKPYVVQEVRYADGRIERRKPEKLKEVLTKRAASLVGGMLVNVVDSGHAGGAAVKGYYVGGKTGTAQIAERGIYSEETNHSFVGFAPVEEPEFVMLVKFEKPQRRFSSSTAAPAFGEIAKFVLEYYGIAPKR